MPDPIEYIKKLEEALKIVLISHGLEVEECSLKAAPDGSINFRADIKPGTLVNKDDFDDWDEKFQDMVKDLEW